MWGKSAYPLIHTYTYCICLSHCLCILRLNIHTTSWNTFLLFFTTKFYSCLDSKLLLLIGPYQQTLKTVGRLAVNLFYKQICSRVAYRSLRLFDSSILHFLISFLLCCSFFTLPVHINTQIWSIYLSIWIFTVLFTVGPLGQPDPPDWAKYKKDCYIIHFINHCWQL